MGIIKSVFEVYTNMQNDKGDIVDLYIPRKCSATGALIVASDHSSVQIEIADVDQNGKINGTKKTLALAGFMRQRGEADACLNRLFERWDFFPSSNEKAARSKNQATSETNKIV